MVELGEHARCVVHLELEPGPVGEMKSVTFIQPGSPSYREPFYTQLRQRLAASGYELRIVVGSQTREARRRDDQAIGLRSRRVKTWWFRLARVAFSFKPSALRIRSDLLVVELGSTILENYVLLLRPRANVAVWGHGGAFVSAGSSLDLRLERWQVRRSKYFFSYTEEGLSNMRVSGRAGQATVVYNSTDTRVLVEAIRTASSASDVIRARYGFSQDQFTALFAGGLDQSKRLDFLLDVTSLIRRSEPTFHLLIAGTGPMHDHIASRAKQEGLPVTLVGYADRTLLAELSSISHCVVMPGRVGLVAVDALAAGLPVVTTQRSDHAPEFGYLRPGVDCIVTPDQPELYGNAIRQLIGRPDQLRGLREAAAKRSSEFSIERMVDAFEHGILQVLDPARRIV